MPGTPHQLRAVEAIVETIVSSPDDIVYISGSLMDGLGNSASDIDVFMVTAGEPQYRGPFGSVLGDFYLGLEVYRLQHMAELSERLNALDASDYRAVWLTPLADLDHYYRTLIGRAYHNPAGFEAMRANFRRDVAEKLLATWCGLRSVIALQLAREELAAGREVDASLAAQTGVASALDAYLASHGEAFPSLKWRFEKLARQHGTATELYESAWELKAQGARSAREYLDAAEALARRLGVDAYAAWQLDDVPLQRIGMLNAYDVAGDAYVVQNGRMAYPVSAAASEIVRRLDELPARRDLGHRSLTEVGEAIASLQGRGLVRAY